MTGSQRRRPPGGDGPDDGTGPPGAAQHLSALAAEPWKEVPEELTSHQHEDVVLDCGWGQLAFGQTFDDLDELAEALRDEQPGRRDICLYAPDAHVLVSRHPYELFIDPSHTYRLWLHNYRPAPEVLRGATIRQMQREEDASSINRLYASRGMIAAPSDTLWANRRTRTFTYLVAEDDLTGKVIGTVTGIDHHHAVGGGEQGSSLWCLAVDPQSTVPGLGEALVRALAEHFQARGRTHLDLSVMYDNERAIALYERLGFRRVPVLCVKRKNPINEPLFTVEPDDDLDALNPYARIIADEARRRGIAVQVLDARGGYLRLSLGGREIVTRESLSELTTAVAMSRCDDKRVTRRVLAEAGLRVPRGRDATGDEGDLAFLSEVGSVVVKPARGEQGRGITVGVNDPAELGDAVADARSFCPDVLLEEFTPGVDLRLVVIDHEVVAAATRIPATVVGDGATTVAGLIERQSRRRELATGGESSIPLDETTEAAVRAAGWSVDDVLPEGYELAVRRTANLHTGGTIHDVTPILHPELIRVASAATRALDIPVTGLDLLVEAPDQPAYVIIEANERPGLANHEPQPTAERFVDLLFPSTRALPKGWKPGGPASVHDGAGSPT